MKLRCENLVKKYGVRTVVKGVSMEVEQGEIVGFLGPNGAGKTTSFYMITGQVVPNGGRIFLDDEEITDLPMYKRAQKGLGYLPQEASVFRKMSVEDNIVSVMEMRGIPKEERERRLESLISEFNLSRSASRWVSSCPAASGAAARSPAPSPWTRSSSSWTSRSPGWTPSPWKTSSTSSPNSSTATSA